MSMPAEHPALRPVELPDDQPFEQPLLVGEEQVDEGQEEVEEAVPNRQPAFAFCRGLFATPRNPLARSYCHVAKICMMVTLLVSIGLSIGLVVENHEQPQNHVPEWAILLSAFAGLMAVVGILSWCSARSVDGATPEQIERMERVSDFEVFTI